MADDKKLVRFDWFVKFMLRDKSNFEILEGSKKKLNVAKLTPAQRQRYDRYLEQLRDLDSYNEVIQKDLKDAIRDTEYDTKYTAAEKGIRKGLSIEIVAEINDLPFDVVIETKQKIDSDPK